MRVLAILAAAAQLTLLLATGAEGWRGRDASAHVERSGTQAHHAHDDATCVACATQSLHAHVAPPMPSWPAVHRPLASAAPITAAPPRPENHDSNGSRAPPLVS